MKAFEQPGVRGSPRKYLIIALSRDIGSLLVRVLISIGDSIGPCAVVMPQRGSGASRGRLVLEAE
jgi:hypothetical protein